VNLVSSPPNENKAVILNEIWKEVSTWDQDHLAYITVAEIFIEYPAKHLTVFKYFFVFFILILLFIFIFYFYFILF
jgi:hypothetical protein